MGCVAPIMAHHVSVPVRFPSELEEEQHPFLHRKKSIWVGWSNFTPPVLFCWNSDICISFVDSGEHNCSSADWDAEPMSHGCRSSSGSPGAVARALPP